MIEFKVEQGTVSIEEEIVSFSVSFGLSNCELSSFEIYWFFWPKCVWAVGFNKIVCLWLVDWLNGVEWKDWRIFGFNLC